MSDLRIGLIGASRVATYAVIAASREVEGVAVTAVAARDPARAAAYASEHGIATVHRDYAALCADPDIDLVYIGTPPALHAEQAIAAIEAGKPVLVEKPFALSSADARRVADRGAARGVPVFEAMHMPHHRLLARLRALLGGGAIGGLRHIEAVFDAPIDPDDPFRWQAGFGGGALMDLGIYPLALVRRLGGEDFRVEAVDAVLRSGVDESFSADLVYPGGLTARLASSMVCPKPVLALRIEGEAGTIKVRNPYVPQLGHLLTLETGAGSIEEIVDGPGSYAAQLAAVRAALVDAVPFPGRPDDFIRSMEAIEAIRARMPGWGDDGRSRPVAPEGVNSGKAG